MKTTKEELDKFIEEWDIISKDPNYQFFEKLLRTVGSGTDQAWRILQGNYKPRTAKEFEHTDNMKQQLERIVVILAHHGADVDSHLHMSQIMHKTGIPPKHLRKPNKCEKGKSDPHFYRCQYKLKQAADMLEEWEKGYYEVPNNKHIMIYMSGLKAGLQLTVQMAGWSGVYLKGIQYTKNPNAKKRRTDIMEIFDNSGARIAKHSSYQTAINQ